MLNSEIWAWLMKVSHRPLDADRNELGKQIRVLQEGFRQRMLDFGESVRSEKHVEVDAIIGAVEHSFKQILIMSQAA